jgi:flagellar motor switch protein FliG
MANGWNSGQEREAMLRRVAIVLSSLPAPVASQLLSAVDPESTKAVRRTMTSLSDVDPLERQRALRAFKISVQQQPGPSHPSNRSAVTEQDRGLSDAGFARSEPTSRVVSPPIPDNRSTQVETSPLSFLGDVDDDDLVRLLSAEHPQAIALVLASIAPAHAARILPHLDPRTRSDALSRVGRLGEIPEAAAAEVAEYFKNSLAQHNRVGTRASGQRTLDAILAAMPSPAPSGPSASPAAGNPSVADPAVARASLGTVEPQRPAAPSRFPSSEIAAIDLTHKLRIAQHTWPETDTDSHHESEAPVPPPLRHPPADRLPAGRQHAELSHADRLPSELPRSEQPSSTDSRPVLQKEHPSTDPADDSGRSALGFDSTDEIHQHLLGLAPEQLCQALGKVETRIAMLALCGLPNQVAESALAVLPRAQAKKVRIKMNSLDSLHLREIDEAKERVAQASLDTSGQTLNQVPVAA